MRLPVLYAIACTIGVLSLSVLPEIVVREMVSAATIETQQKQRAITPHTKRPVMIDAVMGYIMFTNPKVYKDMAAKQARAFKAAAKEYYLPTTTLAAIAGTESHYNHNAVSRAGCVGIMQVDHKVWLPTLIKEGIVSCKRDLYNPVLNIKAGAHIFRHYLDMHRGKGQFIKALAAYNGTTPNKVGRYADKFYTHLGELKARVSEELIAVGEARDNVG